MLVDKRIIEGLIELLKNEFVNGWDEAKHPRDKNGKFCKKNYPTEEEYANPKKDYTLPNIPSIVLERFGMKQKPLVLKKNIIEKNKTNHPEVSITDYSRILHEGIQNVNLVIKNNPQDDYYNFIHFDDNSNPQVLVELSESKTQYEIVNFYILSDKSVRRKSKKAIKKELITRDEQTLIT